MLEIRKGDKVPLPKKYHEINNLLAHIYDLLTEVFADKYYSNLRVTNISLEENEKLKDAFAVEKSNPLDILKEHGANDRIVEVLTKEVTLAVVNDMTNFLYEALNTAKKGKLSVAYSLLRKPFTDELLILEQLLVDKDDFITRFFHKGDIKGYDPSAKSLDKLTIIKSAVSNLKTNIVYNADLIYKLRYDKEMNAGINGITNQALHIVTNDYKYRTANQNLNFVFSNQNDISKQWEHFYTSVPMLLLYSTAIVDKIIFQYIDDVENRLFHKNLKRLLAYLKLCNKLSLKSLKKFYKILGKCFIYECSICMNKNELIKADFDLFFYQNIFLCSKCFNPIALESEVIDEVNKILFDQ